MTAVHPGAKALEKDMKKNVKGVQKKPEKSENIIFRDLAKKIHKIGGDKIVTMLADIPEDVEFPIDSIKCFLAKNEKAVVTCEFGERILYFPWQYRNFFLDEVFCVDSNLQPLHNKTSVYPTRGNELVHENWFFRVEKNPETNYTEWCLLVK